MNIGIVGLISTEDKEINGQVRRITTVHLVSQNTKLQLRGWDLESGTLIQLQQFMDTVVQVARLRKTCFAESLIGEILDSPEGTVMSAHYCPELVAFWAE